MYCTVLLLRDLHATATFGLFFFPGAAVLVLGALKISSKTFPVVCLMLASMFFFLSASLN